MTENIKYTEPNFNLVMLNVLILLFISMTLFTLFVYLFCIYGIPIIVNFPTFILLSILLFEIFIILFRCYTILKRSKSLYMS